MADSVTFDGVNKLAILAPNTNAIEAVEIYSDWKLWLLQSDNLKYELAMSSVGGEPLPGGIVTGAYVFLENGWKVRPNERDHSLQIDGNLFSADGSAIDAPTAGSFRVAIRLNTSSLTQVAVVQSGGGSAYAGDTFVDCDIVPEGASYRFQGGLHRDGAPVSSGIVSASVALYGPNGAAVAMPDTPMTVDARGVCHLVANLSLAPGNYYAETTIADAIAPVVGRTRIRVQVC